MVSAYRLQAKPGSAGDDGGGAECVAGLAPTAIDILIDTPSYVPALKH
jgi:hypothetical protein